MALLSLTLIGRVALASGQLAAEEQAIRDVAARFELAWNTHDMNILASMLWL